MLVPAFRGDTGDLGIGTGNELMSVLQPEFGLEHPERQSKFFAKDALKLPFAATETPGLVRERRAGQFRRGHLADQLTEAFAEIFAFAGDRGGVGREGHGAGPELETGTTHGEGSAVSEIGQAGEFLSEQVGRLKKQVVGEDPSGAILNQAHFGNGQEPHQMLGQHRK